MSTSTTASMNPLMGAGRPNRKRKTTAVAAALVLVGGGAAYAYWTSTGIGEGEATTGASVAFEFTVQSAVGNIAPGNAGQTVGYTVDNPGTSAQYLTDVTVAIANPDGSPWVPAVGCSAADYTAAMTVKPDAGDIPAGGSSAPGTVTVTLANTGVNQDACQGQTVPLYFVAS
jgi:hypothetical protein